MSTDVSQPRSVKGEQTRELILTTALLTDAQTLRDVVYFPQLRRHEGQDEPEAPAES